MSIPTRLFLGLTSLLKNANTSKLQDEYQKYYIDCLNSFFRNEYYTSKIDVDQFVDLAAITTTDFPSKNIHIETFLESVQNLNFINLGNLLTTIFFLKKDSAYLKHIEGATKHRTIRVEENPITFFSPIVISRNADLITLSSYVEKYIMTYVMSNSRLLQELSEKLTPLHHNSHLYFNAMQSHKFVENQARIFSEAFITTYMYGIGGYKALIKHEVLHELLYNYKIEQHNVIVSYQFFFIEAEWDKKTVEAYRKNPMLTDMIEKLNDVGQRIMQNFMRYSEFINVFKTWFFLDILSQTSIEVGQIDALFEEYFNVFKVEDLEGILYCYHVIKSIPELNTYIVYDRTKSSAEWIYNKFSNYKPTFSVL